ncbi:glycoside hydrolase family 5 protein [Botrimarina sp.]|uniref:glycoside hydrolase family 5 protein n=1 Tax=Botrimarina sp. TaxID=2795802 RepID=UPI0032EC2931
MRHRATQRCAALVLGVACVAAASAEAKPRYTGVNLAGADFGESVLPGEFGRHYTYPTAEEVDYYVAKGANVFRVPFRWERLQQSLGGPLDAAELGRLTAVVDHATAAGATVVLDPHNYARYRSGGDELLVGSTALPGAKLADFWSRLADHFKQNDRVVFGLMNEPHSMPAEQWAAAANQALAAIRLTGAENLVLVPGVAWTGAHSWSQGWYGVPNSQAMLDVSDPADNFAFEVHQYLDEDSSGTTSNVVSPTVGRDRLVAFTEWLKQHDRRGFLGEFGVANSTIGDDPGQIGDEAIDHMLDYIEANDDVWLGWTWWAGGPWWGDYRFTIEPLDLGGPGQSDRPSMTLLQPRLVGVGPALAGDFNRDGAVDAADYTVWRDRGGDAAGYAVWIENYGATADALPAPEPRCAVSVLLAAVLATSTRRGA